MVIITPSISQELVISALKKAIDIGAEKKTQFITVWFSILFKTLLNKELNKQNKESAKQTKNQQNT